MSNNSLIVNKTRDAVKWSTITEFSTKLINPITQIILARLLAPEIFGIVVTISMIISFAEIFIDAGFQKYIVQKEFSNDEEKSKNANVAFWTNLIMSLFIWGLIIIFRDTIAARVGSPGYGHVIAIACIQLPMLALSSIQLGLFRRDFDFKTLFYVRWVVAVIPLFTTIPLAFMGLKYWALIIGSNSGILASVLILTIKSKWKPSLFYSFSTLKKMLSFSIWSLFEAISIWLTAWIDSFIIGSILSDYYLGIYKNSLNMVNLIMAIVTSAITPVLFTSLSRLQHEEHAFNNMFLKSQKIIAFLLFPIGALIFLYSDLITAIILGSQWKEASEIIGIWALAKAIRIVTISINSEAYRAKGMPKLSFLLQSIDLLLLIPACFISIKYGFWALVYTRAILMADLIIPGLITMNYIMNIKPIKIIQNISKPIICTGIIIVISVILKEVSKGLVWSVISIFICIFAYAISIFIIAKKDMLEFISFSRGK